MLLLIQSLNAQEEKSAAFRTPLLEKIEVDPTHTEAYADYRLRTVEFGSIMLRDAFVSPLRLVGSGFKIGYNRLHYTPQALKESSTGMFAGIAIDPAAEFNLMLLNFSGQYSWQFPVLEKKGWQGYVGPWAQGFGNMRFALQNVNNVLGYDAGLDLGVTGRLAYKFKPGRREFILTQQLSVPLASGFVRPLYTFTGPILGETDSEVSVFQFGTLNRRFGWIYKASLDLYRNRKRKKQVIERVPYRISYTFQYDQFSQSNALQSAIQTITFSRILKY
ncbi:hypothetical protein [Haliscomenobacter sp.]|uniref:hypothetical protein n=1 Tax=Haliscomenobacter sp. TaxID=2717303 RepID=UPI0035947BCC